MKKREFLMPLAALSAVFATDQAIASIPDATPATPHNNASKELRLADPSGRIRAHNGQDVFSFILRRDAAGVLMASHESHASHASHYSSSTSPASPENPVFPGSSHSSHASHVSHISHRSHISGS